MLGLKICSGAILIYLLSQDFSRMRSDDGVRMILDKWNYMEMEISRRYLVEPIGGYGLEEEVYDAIIPVQPNTTLEFYVVAIENSGNYGVSDVYAYQVSKE
jgi:hypothetical protein